MCVLYRSVVVVKAVEKPEIGVPTAFKLSIDEKILEVYHWKARKKTYQYYLKTKDDNGNGQYIKKSNLKLVETLVQKEYKKIFG